MPSNKLSGRRGTARKPPICITKIMALVYSATKAKIKIVWIQETEPPPRIHLGQTVTVVQDPDDPTRFEWHTPGVVRNALNNVVLTAPFDGSYNALIFDGRDSYGTSHYSENYFPPSQAPPFEQTFDCVSYDYPAPDVLRAEITPIQN